MLIQYTTQCCATTQIGYYNSLIYFKHRIYLQDEDMKFQGNFVCIMKGTSRNVQHTQHSLSWSFQGSYLADSEILGGCVDRDEYNISINNSLSNISGKEEILASHLLYDLKQTWLQIQNGFKAKNRECRFNRHKTLNDSKLSSQCWARATPNTWCHCTASIQVTELICLNQMESVWISDISSAAKLPEIIIVLLKSTENPNQYV